MFITVLLLAVAVCTVWLLVQLYRIKAAVEVSNEFSRHTYDEAHTAAARAKSILEFIYDLKPSPSIALSDLRKEISATHPEDYKSLLEPLLNNLEVEYGDRVPKDVIDRLVASRIRELQEQKQAIIDRGAKQGKTIRIDALRRRLEASKAAYPDSDRSAFAQELDRLVDELASKYGDAIPVDEAYRIMQDLEGSSEGQ